MKLSREAIQRMVSDRVGSGGGGGGGSAISIDDIQGMGFATEQWVNEKYLSIDFFNRLFQAYDSAATPNQVLPNDLESTITNIKAMFGFWTEQFVSALGYGPGGGGGGDTLTEPLASINNASLGMPTAAGQVITWNGSEWIFDIPQGGGGGGTGTVTSITAGTGLSGGTITTMGTIAISSTYQGYISHGETAYGWGNHADAGYATQQWVNQQGFLTSSAISDMATQQWVNQQGFLTSSAISDMATKTWVNQQGFLTSETYTGTVTSVGLSMPQGFSVSDSPITTSGTLSVGIATGYFIPTTTQRTTWNGKQDAISDLSTIRSGAAAGATAVQPSAISDMATQTWVGQQGFITASALSSYLPLTGGTLTGALHMGSAAGASPYIYWGDGSYAYIGEDSDDHIILRGDKGVNILTGSNYELEWNGDTLATQDWVVDQGYLLKSDGMQFYIIDSYVRAQFNPDGGRTAKAQGSGFIEWWASGGYFNHHMGSVEANGNVTVGISTTDTTHYLQIGGGRLFWDNTNNALYVQKADGTAAHFYATGGVSALGMSVGGTPSVNALTVGTLNVNNVATINQLTINGVAYFDDDIVINVGGTNMYLDLTRCVELGILS